jgi:hypothetical protein
MHQVKLFCQERRNLSDLEAEMNRWLRESGAKVVNVIGNISGREVLATPEWARSASGGPRITEFTPSDVFLAVVYQV